MVTMEVSDAEPDTICTVLVEEITVFASAALGPTTVPTVVPEVSVQIAPLVHPTVIVCAVDPNVAA